MMILQAFHLIDLIVWCVGSMCRCFSLVVHVALRPWQAKLEGDEQAARSQPSPLAWRAVQIGAVEPEGDTRATSQQTSERGREKGDGRMRGGTGTEADAED